MNINPSGALVCAFLLTSCGATAQVSMLVSDHGQLVSAETIVPSPAPQLDKSADVVTIGQGSTQPLPPLPPLPPRPRVRSEPIADAEPVPAALPPARTEPAFVEDALPSDVARPDGSGVIVLNPKRKDSAGRKEVIAPHNPWGVRVVTKETLLSYSLCLDGIIIGTQPTALIGSVPVRKGETKAGPFTLYGFRKHEVMMEYDGTIFVLPVGRKITVRIPKL